VEIIATLACPKGGAWAGAGLRLTNSNMAEKVKDDAGDAGAEETVFKGLFVKRQWLIRQSRDPLTSLQKLQATVENYLHILMIKNPLKFNITLKNSMVNTSKEGVKQRATIGFNGELRILLKWVRMGA
jgi:hypothetical protein